MTYLGSKSSLGKGCVHGRRHTALARVPENSDFACCSGGLECFDAGSVGKIAGVSKVDKVV